MICLQSKKLIQNSNICLYFIPLRPFKGFSSEYEVSCRHYMVWENTNGLHSPSSLYLP